MPTSYQYHINVICNTLYQHHAQGDAEATEHKPDAKLSDQIDTKLKLMREQRQKEADGTDNAGDGNPEAEAVEAETPAECES